MSSIPAALALAFAHTAVTAAPLDARAAAPPYTDVVARIERARRALAAERAGDGEARAARRDRARRVLVAALVDDLVPAWAGTPWDYYGTSTKPRQGAIACGYFVTTVLEHLGLRLPRARLAQQASEVIVRSLVVGDGPILRYRDVDARAI